MPPSDLDLLRDLLTRFALDVAAMAILSFGLFYRRYHNKELVTAAALFNVFVFAVLLVLSRVDFDIAAGFGLFAILAVFTLRSEPLSKTEITYFFGSIAIAVITAVLGTSLPFVAVTLGFVLAGAWAFDHPRLLKSVTHTKITLDRIPEGVLNDPARLRDEIRDRLGIDVLSYRILSVDYVTDVVRADVFYRQP